MGQTQIACKTDDPVSVLAAPQSPLFELCTHTRHGLRLRWRTHQAIDGCIGIAQQVLQEKTADEPGTPSYENDPWGITAHSSDGDDSIVEGGFAREIDDEVLGGGTPNALSQLPDGWISVQIGDLHARFEFLVDPLQGFKCEERMSTNLEEVVVPTDPIELQKLDP